VGPGHGMEAVMRLICVGKCVRRSSSACGGRRLDAMPLRTEPTAQPGCFLDDLFVNDLQVPAARGIGLLAPNRHRR
jgi:hypothetical protein